MPAGSIRAPAQPGWPAHDSAAAGVASARHGFNLNEKHNITVGKYLISPLTRLLENGWYASSVSIRSGSGTGTHDRVLRLTRLFQDHLAAVRYATAEGLQWIGHRHPATAGGAPVAL
jgi:hypothetical protein